MRPAHGWFVRTFGHALLTTGLAFLLIPTWQGALVAFVLGAFIGLAKLVPSRTLQLVFPVFASFVCALAVFLIAPYFDVGDPIRLLIAPLATFLPGGVLTTGTVELASGQMIAGASRLVFGLVQLALLSFGILAAGTVVGVASSTYVSLEASDPLPWWTRMVGVLLFAVGNYLHFSAPGSVFGWVLLAMVVAYTAQSIAATADQPDGERLHRCARDDARGALDREPAQGCAVAAHVPPGVLAPRARVRPDSSGSRRPSARPAASRTSRPRSRRSCRSRSACSSARRSTGPCTTVPRSSPTFHIDVPAALPRGGGAAVLGAYGARHAPVDLGRRAAGSRRSRPGSRDRRGRDIRPSFTGRRDVEYSGDPCAPAQQHRRTPAASSTSSRPTRCSTATSR